MMGLCMYCKTYQESTKRTVIDDETCRLCTVNKKFVHKGESCENFSLSNLFWCIKWEHFQNVKVCAIKRLKRKEDCLNCKQGRELAEIRKEVSFRERGLVSNNPVPRKLIIRRPK
jgi:hypothetical protein